MVRGQSNSVMGWISAQFCIKKAGVTLPSSDCRVVCCSCTSCCWASLSLLMEYLLELGQCDSVTVWQHVWWHQTVSLHQSSRHNTWCWAAVPVTATNWSSTHQPPASLRSPAQSQIEFRDISNIDGGQQSALQQSEGKEAKKKEGSGVVVGCSDRKRSEVSVWLSLPPYLVWCLHPTPLTS